MFNKTSTIPFLRILKIWAVLLLTSGSLLACSKQTETVEEDIQSMSAVTQTETPICDPMKTPGINCDCVSGLIERNWSDYEELDASAIIANKDTAMTQASIDVLIDISLQSDKNCSTRP